MPGAISPDQLERAWDALDAALGRRDVSASVVLFGDAALRVVHGVETGCSRVDVIATPRGPVMAAAREVASSVGLDEGWLSDRTSGSVPTHLDSDVVEVSRRANLRVQALGPDILLAMEVVSPQEKSAQRLGPLASAAGLSNSVEIEVLVAEIYPGRALKSSARTMLDELF